MSTHIAICTNPEDPTIIKLEICDDNNDAIAEVCMGLATAEDFGKSFYEHYNKCLERTKARYEQ